jgi:hypothetical protein
MTIPPANYKTFSELAEYAKERAKISAKRNGHQEFAYWLLIHRWANDCADDKINLFLEFIANRNRTKAISLDAFDKAEAHAFAVHCRIMLKNRGEKVERMSLDWLREAAKKL